MAGPSFCFNFALDAAADGADGTDHGGNDAAAVVAPAPLMRHGERFHFHGDVRQLAFKTVPVALSAGDGAFEIVNTTDAGFMARTGAIQSILTTSDVQTGVYEGGFKLWECSVDLTRYLDHLLQSGQYTLPPRVMELGCGHALPGIYALQHGAERVAFLDYNKEVLELTTCPNVIKNVAASPSLYDRAVFYAGAWSSVTEFMANVEQQGPEDQQYDLILTAETIYTEAVAIELYQTIKRHLRRSPSSVALVAAKKYYFGTGGSVQHFLSLVTSEGVLNASVVWEEQDCRSNIRSIVQVKYAA